MKARQPAVVVLECFLLFIGLITVSNWVARTFFYRYAPSLEHESAFLRDYSVRPVIEPFAVKAVPIGLGDGIGSKAGRRFVTNERTVDPTVAIRPDMRLPLMTALYEDLCAQLIRNGATIIARRGNPQEGFHLTYRDGLSAGTITLPPLADRNRPNPVPEGTKLVGTAIVISEKWFPNETNAIRASVEPQ
jgi:hypothetical protein